MKSSLELYFAGSTRRMVEQDVSERRALRSEWRTLHRLRRLERRFAAEGDRIYAGAWLSHRIESVNLVLAVRWNEAVVVRGLRKLRRFIETAPTEESLRSALARGPE